MARLVFDCTGARTDRYAIVPSFILVPFSYDLQIASTRYFSSLDDDTHFPDAAWITMSRKTLDDLIRFKTRHALPTWDATVPELLTQAGRDEP
jgi:Family of unknown function (DUF6084)